MSTLAKYHINGLQFYDWQYRHDQLVPPQEDYLDPLGRPLSLARIRALIAAAHRHGMAAMPYLTIYAASAAFWKSHPEWMLYDKDQHPIPFGEDFLGIMNPQKNGPWHQHLLAECESVLAALPFDGLHIDQFGEPKLGYDHAMQAVDIPLAFGDFISAVSTRHPQAAIVFNAVGNWPIETLAPSATTYNYIEIWPPDIYYTDLVRIVRNARRLSAGKPVVIALYIPATRPVNNLLANALIISAGGTRIELGENARLLTDPYFPEHEEMSAELACAIRKQNDFIVRFEEWFGPLLEETSPAFLTLPAGIQTFYRKGASIASLSLVNLISPAPLAWNVDTPAPGQLDPFEIIIGLDACPKSVSSVNPAGETISPSPVEFSYQNGHCTIKILGLSLWMVLLIEF
jgi:dextranase